MPDDPPPGKVDVGKIKEPAKEFTFEAGAEEIDTAAYKEEIQNEFLEAQLESFRQNTGERRKYAKGLFRLVVGWTCGVYALLLLQGFWGDSKTFYLSDNVLIAVIATSGLTGIFLVVAKYLFPGRDSDKQ